MPDETHVRDQRDRPTCTMIRGKLWQVMASYGKLSVPLSIFAGSFDQLSFGVVPIVPRLIGLSWLKA